MTEPPLTLKQMLADMIESHGEDPEAAVVMIDSGYDPSLAHQHPPVEIPWAEFPDCAYDPMLPNPQAPALLIYTPSTVIITLDDPHEFYLRRRYVRVPRHPQNVSRRVPHYTI